MSYDVSEIDSVTLKNIPQYAIEKLLFSFPQLELPVDHSFCNGLYARTLFIPAGTILSGAVHKDESFFIVRSGVLRVTTDDGVITVLPGFMNVTKSGTKRIGYAITDVLCTTIHMNPDNTQGPSELWDSLTIPPPENISDILAFFDPDSVRVVS